MTLAIAEAVSLSSRLLAATQDGAPGELREQLLALRAALLDAKAEFMELTAELDTLKAAAAAKDTLRFDGFAYWRDLPENKRDGPFCQRCVDADHSLVHLQRNLRGLPRQWVCTVCGTAYLDP